MNEQIYGEVTKFFKALIDGDIDNSVLLISWFICGLVNGYFNFFMILGAILLLKRNFEKERKREEQQEEIHNVKKYKNRLGRRVRQESLY